MKPAITESITQSFAETEFKGKVEKKAGKRVGFNYIIVKSYKESQKNDVVKCLYIKSLKDFGFCVIKEGTHGDSKDKHGRDIIDRLKWQKQLHELLQKNLRIPRLLGTFEERGNYYLVIEHIKGKALNKVISENRKELRDSLIKGNKLGMNFLNYLLQICEILSILHAAHIVHRDATPNNYMITTYGKVSLIDLEMCYSLHQQFPTPAFQLGTYGYMSPQQEATEVPTVKEDIFALGAIIFQIWSGISPGKISNEPFQLLQKKIKFFIRDKQMADMVIQSLMPEDRLRPSASDIKTVVLQYKNALKQKLPRPTYTSDPFSNEEIIITLQNAISTLASPLLADENKGWFADNMTPDPNADKNKLHKAWYASFARGDFGTIYMLSQANKIELDIASVSPFIKKGLERVYEKYISRIEKASPGLHNGSDGIAATLALAIQNGLIEPNHVYLEWIDLLLGRETITNNIISGVAGQGIANLFAKSFVSPHTVQKRLEQYVQYLLDRQTVNGNWVYGSYRQKFTKREMPRITRGFAEGMAGTICFLLAYAKEYQNEQCLESAYKGLNWLAKNAIQRKGKIQWLSSKQRELAYGLADGTAGIALAFLKGYEITKNPNYRITAERSLIGIPETLIDNNLSQSRGLSGLGEVYVEAYRILGSHEWLHRASWIAQVIMQLKKQHSKYGPYWLVEHERQPVSNFMFGNSGIIHFLLRFCYPEKINFPLLPS